MNRTAALLYGLASYTFALGSIVYAVGFTSGLVVPKTVDTGDPTPLLTAMAIDSILIALFAVQHSIMARSGFKSWWTSVIPKSVERSTYVLLSGIVLAVVMWQWRPIPTIVWGVSDAAVANAFIAVCLLGWCLVVASTFLINHFELFGLEQVAKNYLRKDLQAPRFRTPSMYKIVRHPLYLGLLIAFWATPTMTVGHLLFAFLNTIYIVGGIVLEERDLIGIFGEDYRRYKTRVPMLLPLRWVGGEKMARARREHGLSE